MTALSPHTATGEDVTNRWLLLGGVWGIYFAFGLVIGSTAALVPAIRTDLDLSRGEMGAVLGAWQLVYLGASVPCGRLLDRIGLRRGLALAAVVIVASGLLRATSQNLTTLLLTVGLFGIGGPLISIGAPKFVSVWFSDAERRTAVGIYGTAPAIGMTVALALANGVVAPVVDDSWRTTAAIFALVGVAPGLYWWVMAGRAPDRQVAVDEAAGAMSSRELLRLPIVRVVLAVALGGFLYSHAIANWLVEMVEDTGRSVASAGYWAAIPTFVGIFATLAVPKLATPERRVGLLSAMFVLGGIGIVGVLASAAVVLAPSLVATGIARTTVMPLCMLVLMDHERVGSTNMAAAAGLFFTAAEIGGVSGPALTGVLAQATDGFAVPVTVLAAVSGAMALLTLTIPTAARRSNTTSPPITQHPAAPRRG